MASPQHTTTPLQDRFRRTIDYARIAVTSRCNLRCAYCLREEHDTAESGRTRLETREIGTIVETLAGLGIRKIRFTGGEPLLRSDIAELVRHAKSTPGIETVSLTTNGLLLHRHLPNLLKAGLDAVNLSLDSLDRERFRLITRRDEFRRIKANLDTLLQGNFLPLKINVVMLRGVNDDEIGEFVELTRHHPVTVRFMELQPFDDHQIWRTGKFLGTLKIRELLLERYPELLAREGGGTEFYSFTLPGYRGKVAIIPAYTRNFCSQCNRLRVTAEGKVISCLYEREGIDLLEALRSGAGREELAALFARAAARKPEDGRKLADEGGAKRTSMSEIGG